MPRPLYPPRLRVYAGCVCALATAAAVVSFIRGGWVGIVWVLLAGLASNMTWYYARRGGGTAGNGTGTRARVVIRRPGPGGGTAPASLGCEGGGACGVCVKTTSKEPR
ncbi:hypothetical protein [Streptomyces sp. HUAS ZL42]|uniref:hypothetical protein n=1 Tax=Streptomyces sp. HUAS ZL42 TaxID=3231715 RepID=UPI00345E1366